MLERDRRRRESMLFGLDLSFVVFLRSMLKDCLGGGGGWRSFVEIRLVGGWRGRG